MEERGNWTSRRAFILAAIGSAIGLGNIWRFPFKCYENGGGAFLFAYLIALISAGIPLLIMELSLGHRFKLSAPLAFANIKKKFEWIGWWAVGVGFVIVTYYAVIMAWGLNYTVFSLTKGWGQETSKFFYEDFLGLTDGPLTLGGIRFPILIALVISWVLIVAAIWKGAKTVSKVVYATVFLPWLILIIFVIRGVTLPGSMDGLTFYLQPHFGKLLDPSVWVAAYGQIFYSLSLGFGIMIAYASFLPKDSDIINNSYIIALSNSATAYIGGFAVFGALGYYAQLIEKPIEEVLKGGPGLAFVTYPTIINNLPFGNIFGLLFFIMLLTLAVDSAFSLVEAVSSSLRDNFGWTHKKSNILVALVSLGCGVIFTTGAGLYWLDIVDKWIGVFGLVIVILFETIVLAWFYRINRFRKYANLYSDIKIGEWWNKLLKYLLPLVIGALLINEALKLILEGYEGYPQTALLFGGWIVVIIVPILAIIFSKIGKKFSDIRSDIIKPKRPFRFSLGFKRLYLYFKVVLILGIILILFIFLSNPIPNLKNYITAAIAVYIFIALIGGALYFTVISMKDGDKRTAWGKKYIKE